MHMVGVARFKVSLQIYLGSLAGFSDTVCLLVVMGENPGNRVGAEISDAFALWFSSWDSTITALSPYI